MSPLAVDLCCGLGGWTEGLRAEGYHARGYDIEAHEYDGERYQGDLVLKSILDLDGAECADADLIVASPPCTEYSYMAMPWRRAKQIAAALRGEGDFPEGYRGSRTLADLTALFDACFRIQREASAAAGRPIPMVLENVRGAEPWVGRARWNFGSYYLWGDVPALMPPVSGGAIKAPGLGAGWVHPSDPRHTPGLDFTRLAGLAAEGRKVPGFRFDGSGRSFQTASVNEHTKAPGGAHRLDGAPHTARLTNPGEHRKGGGDWFGSGPDCSLQRRAASGSTARKAASAKIAKIPEPLARWIGRAWLPREEAA